MFKLLIGFADITPFYKGNDLMNARPRISRLFGKTLLLLFALILGAIWMITARPTPRASRVQEERVFENTIPKDAPIKVKIKKEKEKSFKDVKNEKWLREFELEVKNTGDKPIYFLYLTLVTDVKVGGDRLVFPLVYGRVELGDLISKAQQDDVPITPGETYVFKIHPGQVPAWEQSVREKSHSESTRLKTELQSISFGDGTGYFLNKPYPGPDERQSKRYDQIHRPNRGELKAREIALTGNPEQAYGRDA